MDIEHTLDAHLKEAMRGHDKPRVQCIRQVRSKLQEARNQANFAGPEGDPLLVQVIASYVKQLEKSCVELAQGGARGAVLVEQYRQEMAYLGQFLPTQMQEPELRRVVADHMKAVGATEPRHAGKVLGALMKELRGRIDAKLAKQIVDELLQKAANTAAP